MSFYEGNVADGSHCMACLQYIGEGAGYPRCCTACGGHGSTKYNKATKKADAIDRFDQWLSATGVGFEKHNHGLHVVLTLRDGRKVDSWPTTKKWQLRGGKISTNPQQLDQLVRNSK